MLKDSKDVILSTWKAIYDGLGRRIRTVYTPYKDGKAEEGRMLTLTSLYDPEMEFLELGLVVQVGKGKPRTIWKAYGPNNSGTYGENNGIGSLEAVVEGDTGETHGVINNIQGDIIASVDRDKRLCWH